MYKNILVPISFDNDRDAAGAIDVAKMLADTDGIITLLHVIENVPSFVLTSLPSGLLAKRRQEAQAELDAMAANLPNGASIVTSGHSGRTVLDWAADKDVDCIVIASHRPGMRDLLLGSTATQVVRHATCAVHVIR
ncbi:Universal stress family protein RD1_4076 [hydrothermal vent metagenome]|uniref:Universal stress family protein RD1_4076 n=1 Tax=hydrothermal vent metagenome TaxID=652676 RepID=A0A3B0RXE8_9ZZZZ